MKNRNKTFCIAHMYPYVHDGHEKHLELSKSLSCGDDVGLVPVEGKVSDSTLKALREHPNVIDVFILPEEEYEKSTQIIIDKDYGVISLGKEGLENTWETTFWKKILGNDYYLYCNVISHMGEIEQKSLEYWISLNNLRTIHGSKIPNNEYQKVKEKRMLNFSICPLTYVAGTDKIFQPITENEQKFRNVPELLITPIALTKVGTHFYNERFVPEFLCIRGVEIAKATRIVKEAQLNNHHVYVRLDDSKDNACFYRDIYLKDIFDEVYTVEGSTDCNIHGEKANVLHLILKHGNIRKNIPYNLVEKV